MLSQIMCKFREVRNGAVSLDEKIYIQRRVTACVENNEELPFPLQMTRASQVVLKFVHLAFVEYADMLKRWHDDLYIDANNEEYNERKALVYLCMASKVCDCLNMKRAHHGTALLKVLSLMRLYQETRSKCNLTEVLYNFGRVAHYIGCLDLAVAYYRDCLASDDLDDDSRGGSTIDVRNAVKKHAAFNLHLIYRSIGENALAMKLMHDYLVV